MSFVRWSSSSSGFDSGTTTLATSGRATVSDPIGRSRVLGRIAVDLVAAGFSDELRDQVDDLEAQLSGCAPRAAVVGVTDDEPADNAEKPNRLGEERRHTDGCAATGRECDGSRHAPSAATKSSNPSGDIVQSLNATGPHTMRK